MNLAGTLWETLTMFRIENQVCHLIFYMCVYLTVVLQIMAIIVTNCNDQRGAPHIPTVTKGQCQKGVSYKILILNR